MLSNERLELMKYRITKAEKTLEIAKKIYVNATDEEDYASVLNRTYYCIFHSTK